MTFGENESRVLAVQHIGLLELVNVVTASGQVFNYSTLTGEVSVSVSFLLIGALSTTIFGQVEVVGDVGCGISAAAWSPDQEVSWEGGARRAIPRGVSSGKRGMTSSGCSRFWRL